MTKKKLKLKKKTTKKKLELQNEEGFVYEKEKTLKILSSIKPGLALKDIVEGMKNFYFDGKNVITYNDKISIMHPFKTDFKSFIHADTLYKLISKLPFDKFKIKSSSENQISIIAKGLNVSLPSIIDEEVVKRISVVNKGIKKVKWNKLPDNFVDSINLCSFAASTSETESTISCVRLENKVCVATDSKRLAYAKLNQKIEPMFIKASEIKHLFAINPTHYSSNKGWLFFKNEEKCVFSIRRIEGEFPKWKHLFKFKGTQINLPKELLSGIDLASVFSENGSVIPLHIYIEKNKCFLSLQTESGKLDYKIPIEYDQKPFDFVINPDFLKEMMKFDTTITFVGKKAKLETENYAILTALWSKDEDEGERYTRYKKEK